MTLQIRFGINIKHRVDKGQLCVNPGKVKNEIRNNQYSKLVNIKLALY